ncbi:MAG: rhodanese-like domain-containing protein [Gammaproteobacteria bacterium]|nr:rhodanese-like domain-containing protein [Gammaproteobacteria bacterium]
MNTTRFLKSFIFLGLTSLGLSLASLNLQAAEVNITAEVESVAVRHGDSEVKIMRNQNQKNTVNPAFAKTSRKCPPFCIQPSTLAPGVETIAELEVLDYLKRMSEGDDSILVIDSRTPAWVAKGTIPGSINIPWTTLNPAKGADPISIGEILEGRFNAQNLEGLWDYRNARTLVMFCNGMWCGQSPNNIKNLLGFGYPAHKIKWYRGGMQNWEILGLTTAKPISE